MIGAPRICGGLVGLMPRPPADEPEWCCAIGARFVCMEDDDPMAAADECDGRCPTFLIGGERGAWRERGTGFDTDLQENDSFIKKKKTMSSITFSNESDNIINKWT